MHSVLASRCLGGVLGACGGSRVSSWWHLGVRLAALVFHRERAWSSMVLRLSGFAPIGFVKA